MNRYMKLIWEAQQIKTDPGPLKSRKHLKELYKFIKDIKASTPNFHDLWEIGEFVKNLEYSYFYDNSLENTDGIFSSSGYKPMENGFKIRTDDVSIVCKLYYEDETGIFEVERLRGTKYKSTITLDKDGWKNQDIQLDELLFDNIIRIIWDRVCNLLLMYDVIHLEKMKSFSPYAQ